MRGECPVWRRNCLQMAMLRVAHAGSAGNALGNLLSDLPSRLQMFAALFGLLLCVDAAADAARFTVKATSSAADAKATFMIVSGITSGAEMCVVAEGGAVDVDGAAALLEPCLEAIAAGDGRELWQFESAGAIMSAQGHKCLQAPTRRGVAAQGKVRAQDAPKT